MFFKQQLQASIQTQDCNLYSCKCKSCSYFRFSDFDMLSVGPINSHKALLVADRHVIYTWEIFSVDYMKLIGKITARLKAVVFVSFIAHLKIRTNLFISSNGRNNSCFFFFSFFFFERRLNKKDNYNAHPNLYLKYINA